MLLGLQRAFPPHTHVEGGRNAIARNPARCRVAEKVGFQVLSLRQRTLPQHSPLALSRSEWPRYCGLFGGKLWTALSSGLRPIGTALRMQLVREKRRRENKCSRAPDKMAAVTASRPSPVALR